MQVDRYIETKDGHRLAVYRKGNPQKPKVLFLHGGPGGRISEDAFSFFDLEAWDVIAFDQRGCGQSKPFASLKNNTVFDAVKDIEQIRQAYGVDKWYLFGGSYGSTLALSYAIHYPKHVHTMVLRGIFLGREEDIHWLYQEGASYFYPIEHEKFKNIIDKEKQDDLVTAYYEIFQSEDEGRKKEAAKAWADWESSLVHLIPQTDHYQRELTETDISIAILECHFFANKMFWNDDHYLLNRLHIIEDIPTHIVHGRYDVDCRPSAAYELAKGLKNSHLYFVEASGHSPYEEANFDILKEIMHKLSQ